MKMMSKRILSLLLSLVLLVGLIPMGAFAAETEKASTVVDAAIIFSDLHTGKYDYKESTLTAIMNAFKKTGLPFSSVTSAGDAFSVNKEKDNTEANRPYTGLTGTLNGYIRSVFPNISVSYVWSDHDRYAVLDDGSTPISKKSYISYGAGADGELGTDDDGNYYVYNLSMADLCSYDRYVAGFNYTESNNNRAAKGFTATVPEAIANFVADAEKLHKDRPLLIASHQPLLDNRNDNAWAEDWFDAINEVAEEMDVVFFFGHNHKYDSVAQNNYDYYYAKGSKLPVATDSNWGFNYETGAGEGGYKPSMNLASASKTLNFTHLCTGYLEPTSTGSYDKNTTRTGTAMAVTIYNDSIGLTTYNKDGVYTGNYSVNTTVPRAHAVVVEPTPTPAPTQEPTPTPAPTQEPTPTPAPEKNEVSDEATRVSVKAPGAKKLTVTTVEKPAAAETVFTGDVVAYDITVDGFENESGTADVTIPIPDGMDASRFAVYHVHENGEMVEVAGEVSEDSKTYTFHTTHFSVYVGGVKVEALPEGDGETKPGELSAGISHYELYTGDIVPGEEYLIASGKSDKVTILSGGLSAGPGETVTHISNVSVDNNKIAVNDSYLLWKFENSTFAESYYHLIANGLYMKHDGKLEAPKNNKLNEFQVSFSKDENGGYNIYLNKLNDDGSVAKKRGISFANGTFSAADNSTPTPLYLYKAVEETGTSVDFTLNKPADMATEDTQDLAFEITLDDNTEVKSYDIEWESTDHQIVTFGDQNNDGKYDCLVSKTTGGTATITAKLTKVNGLELVDPIEFTVDDEYTVTVKAPTIEFSVTPASESLVVGGTVTIVPTVTYNGAVTNNYEVTYKSSNTDVATVDENGKVTAVANGDTVITATLTKANGKTVNYTFPVNISVTEKQISAITVEPMVFSVERGTVSTAVIGKIKVTYEGNSTGEVDLTLGMLKGEYKITENGTYKDLSVTFGGKTVTGLTLNVVDVSGDNYPEYPNPGSVNIDKTADATYLQQSGIVNVELSTSGLPYAKGVDVIVMLDLSSSMDKCVTCNKYTNIYTSKGTSNDNTCKCQTKVSRVDELLDSLEELETALKSSANAEDIKISVASFNGFENNGYIANSGDDVTEDKGALNAENKGEFFTHDATTNSDFVSASEFDADDIVVTKQNGLCSTGTNYDYGLDMIYQLGTKIKAENKAKGQEDRELFVLFMSDGAANQYNFYSSNGNSTDWNYWLMGAISGYGTSTTFDGGQQTLAQTVKNDKHYYFFDGVDHDGDGYINEHRMGNAIKGSPESQYEIVRKATTGLENVMTKADKDYLYTVPGLGAELYSIAFRVYDDINVKAESAKHTLQQIAQDADHYVDAANANELAEAFKHIGGKIANAAENAYFVDQLGDSFELQMSDNIKARNESGNVVDTTLSALIGSAPAITVSNYKIYKASDVGTKINNVEVTEEMVGKRYGDPTVVEKVTFNSDGTVTSTAVDGNILKNGVICAKNFYYNTTSSYQTVDGITLAPESFRWNIGTISNAEWVLDYYVYLTGSMDGKASSGSYKTNNYATLYYKNWLGNDAHLDTTSPQVGWESANVSYAFYLVNDKGEPIVNQTTGQTGNFTNAVKVTQPVVYDEIFLNNIENINTIEASSAAILPDGYDLYDKDASYKVVILSQDGKGSWTITSGKEPPTTYVTGYAGNESTTEMFVTSNKSVMGENADQYKEYTNYDYTHTTVWFAVVWVPKTIPDAVVVDYGLPVDISVLANDQFGTNGYLIGVGTTGAKTAALENAGDEKIYTAAPSADFGATLDANYGKAELNGTKVRYTPTTMSWSGENKSSFDKFAYEVKYEQYEYNKDANGNLVQGELKTTQYYYGDVAVIPATTVYYEDTFLTLTTCSEDVEWVVGTSSDATQAEDRPGEYNLPAIDANNVYGYDGAYTNFAQHSLDSAAKVHLEQGQYATAEFTFYGTGFDVISVTSADTGVLAVQVSPGATFNSGNLVRNTMVDTYYGMLNNGEISVNSPEALYQIPVMKISGLEYQQYTVRITATYIPIMDHNTSESGYDLYLDAIRIYDPAGEGEDVVYGNTTIEDIYAMDSEGWPLYAEVRNQLIDEATYKNATDSDTFKGAIFIDGKDENFSVSDYINYGPNNEVYLAQGQAIAFELDLSDYVVEKTVNGNTYNESIVADVQIGVKSADGSTVKVTLTADDVAASRNFSTASDMYYSFSQLVDMGTGHNESNDSKTIVTIQNTSDSDSIVSLTNLKVTFKEDPNGEGSGNDGTETAGVFSWSRNMASRAIMMLSAEPEIEEETPETSQPETSEPETPETSEPETSEPEVSEPEVSEPEESKPEDKKPGANKPGAGAKPKPEKEEKPKPADKAQNDKAKPGKKA